jgi:hypothetical protein
LNVVRFVIGLVLTVGGALLFFINGNSFPSVQTVIFLVVTFVGFVLTIVSGFEARLIMGIIIGAGSLYLYSRERALSQLPEVEFLLVPAVIGVLLIVSALPTLLNRGMPGSDWLTSIKTLFFRRGGYQGTVRNLRKEDEVTNFWLVGAMKDGTAIRVVVTISGDTVGEGDTVWVRGEPDQNGELRTNQVQILSKGGASELQKRKGKAEFSGTVIGGMYEMQTATILGMPLGWPFPPKSGFRIERVDAQGSPVDIIEVEIPGYKYKGLVFDRDSVIVKGKWETSGKLRLTEIENLTSKTKTRL